MVLEQGFALLLAGLFGSCKHSFAVCEKHSILPSYLCVNRLDLVKYKMKTILLALSMTLLTGCAAVVKYIPSFWDDNQSARIIDVRLRAESIDCGQPQLPQVRALAQDLRWFELYSQSKGLRQTDVLKLIQPMQDTVKEWQDRSQRQEGTKFYCETKKKIVVEQSKRAAEATLGRF